MCLIRCGVVKTVPIEGVGNFCAKHAERYWKQFFKEKGCKKGCTSKEQHNKCPQYECSWYKCKKLVNNTYWTSDGNSFWVNPDTSWSAFDKYCDSEDNLVQGMWAGDPKRKKYSIWNDDDYREWKNEPEQKPWLDRNIIVSYYCEKHYIEVKRFSCGCKDLVEHWNNPVKKCKDDQEKHIFKYVNNKENIYEMSKAKLKHAIEKDIAIMNGLLPIENPNVSEDDSDSWDEDVYSEVLEEIKKVKAVLESKWGLNEKLQEWNNRLSIQEQIEDDENTDPFDDENCSECGEKLETKKEKEEGIHKGCEEED